MGRCIPRARSSSGNPRPKTLLSGPDRQAGREDGFAEQLGGDAEFAEKASKHFGGTITEAHRLRMPVAEGGGDGFRRGYLHLSSSSSSWRFSSSSAPPSSPEDHAS